MRQSAAKRTPKSKAVSKKSSVRKSSAKKDGATTDKKPRRSTKKDSSASQKPKGKRGRKPKRQLTAIEEHDENSEEQPVHAFGLDDQESANEEAHQEDQFQDQEMNGSDAPEQHPEDALSHERYIEQDNQQ